MDQSAQPRLSNTWRHLNLEVRRDHSAFCDMAGTLGINRGGWGACPIGAQPVFLADSVRTLSAWPDTCSAPNSVFVQGVFQLRLINCRYSYAFSNLNVTHYITRKGKVPNKGHFRPLPGKQDE